MGQTCRWKGRGHTSCGLLESLALMLHFFERDLLYTDALPKRPQQLSLEGLSQSQKPRCSIPVSHVGGRDPSI